MIELLIAGLALVSGYLLAPTKVEYREVNVGVPVACKVEVPVRPAMPTDTLALDADVDVQNRAMRAEIELRDGHEDRLLTALQACRRPIAQEP